jgi:hypothetical protein
VPVALQQRMILSVVKRQNQHVTLHALAKTSTSIPAIIRRSWQGAKEKLKAIRLHGSIKSKDPWKNNPYSDKIQLLPVTCYSALYG